MNVQYFMEPTKNLFKKNLTKNLSLKNPIQPNTTPTLNVGLIDSFFRPALLMFKTTLIIKFFNLLGYVHKQIIRDWQEQVILYNFPFSHYNF